MRVMRKLISLTMTVIAIGEGAIALSKFLRKHRDKRRLARGDAVEIRTPDGETVIYKPAGEHAVRGDTISPTAETGAKPHQDKPSRMGLAGENA